MKRNPAIAIAGTFDSKGEEHLFLKEQIEARGFRTLTINLGTNGPSPFTPDYDLYTEVIKSSNTDLGRRDKAIQSVLSRGQELIRELHDRGEISGIICAGGGTGTYLGARIMHTLPLGTPKVIVSTVASRNMSEIVGTKDMTIIHSVVDILGVNSILGGILDKAAGTVCGMVESQWSPRHEKRRIALTMFGFITPAAEQTKEVLRNMGYEVVAFHANGTGGMAMEELAADGHFHGILDLATHELADQLKGGYCAGIGPRRLEPPPGRKIPRLVVPGGLDCAVLEFTRHNIPEEYKGRKIFFYDFRSAIRLDLQETILLAGQMAEKLNPGANNVRVLIPMKGWSEADREGGPLYDAEKRDAFVRELSRNLDPAIKITKTNLHINDPQFGRLAASIMDEMLQ